MSGSGVKSPRLRPGPKRETAADESAAVQSFNDAGKGGSEPLSSMQAVSGRCWVSRNPCDMVLYRPTSITQVEAGVSAVRVSSIRPQAKRLPFSFQYQASSADAVRVNRAEAVQFSVGRQCL